MHGPRFKPCILPQGWFDAEKIFQLIIQAKNIMTQTNHLDCRGLPCPQPVLRVKEALEDGTERLTVLIDNEAAKNNVLRFARTQGCTSLIVSEQDGTILLNITANQPQQQDDHASAALPTQNVLCDTPQKEKQEQKQKILLVIAANSMGRGSEELGWALLQTYIQTIKELRPLPEKIIFYNSGVKLLTEASGALDALLHLQEQGVEILACGTCLDFFQLKSTIRVGQISNMFAIMSAMMEADKIISPL